MLALTTPKDVTRRMSRLVATEKADTRAARLILLECIVLRQRVNPLVTIATQPVEIPPLLLVRFIDFTIDLKF